MSFVREPLEEKVGLLVTFNTFLLDEYGSFRGPGVCLEGNSANLFLHLCCFGAAAHENPSE